MTTNEFIRKWLGVQADNDEINRGLMRNDLYEVLSSITDHDEKSEKRFKAACCAMQGILAGRKEPMEKYGESLVKMSFEIADEMLKEEEKP